MPRNYGSVYEDHLQCAFQAGGDAIRRAHETHELPAQWELLDTLGRLGIRPSVARMALGMERKLRTKDASRGPTGWSELTEEMLKIRMAEEARELFSVDKSSDRAFVEAFQAMDEAADVANYAMMLAERKMGIR